jgi:hypothetical protein
MIRWLGLVGRSAVTVANDEMGERERESEACCREREREREKACTERERVCIFLLLNNRVGSEQFFPMNWEKLFTFQ